MDVIYKVNSAEIWEAKYRQMLTNPDKAIYWHDVWNLVNTMVNVLIPNKYVANMVFTLGQFKPN